MKIKNISSKLAAVTKALTIVTAIPTLILLAIQLSRLAFGLDYSQSISDWNGLCLRLFGGCFFLSLLFATFGDGAE
jgi:hypothetical protein